MQTKFSKEAFEALGVGERPRLAQELAESLRTIPRDGRDFHRACYAIIDDLRSLGHDLWSLDESDDFQIWGPDYQKGHNRGLTIRFESEGRVEIDWHE